MYDLLQYLVISLYYVIVKVPPCMCTENTARWEACREANTVRGEAECCVCQVLHFSYTKA